MIEYIITLSKEDAAKLAAKADLAGVICDLEYLQERVIEFINNDNQMEIL